MELKIIAKEIHANAKAKGFFEKEKNMGEMLCLIHSEISEALEADRKGKYMTASIIGVNGWVSDEDFKRSFCSNVKGNFEEEMADIIIRVLDMCEYRGIDIEGHLQVKMRYNSLREHKHGKSY